MASNDLKIPSGLRWEITSSEEKEKEKNQLKIILKLLPIFVVISFVVFLTGLSEFEFGKILTSFVSFWIFMSVVVILLYLKNSI